MPELTQIPEGLEECFKYPLLEALFNRRSRRFGLGMEMAGEPLRYKSAVEPIPLSELEEAVLVWAATGLTGLCLGDLPPRTGLTWLIQWTGRTWPCACNGHGTELFYTNDSGTYMVKLFDLLPDSAQLQLFRDLDDKGKLELILELLRKSRIRVEDGRADLPQEMPGLFEFNQWNTNRPGTTLFLPITDITLEYINLLFIFASPKYGLNVVDEMHGSRSAGLKRWFEEGAFQEKVRMSLVDLEVRVITMLVVEQAFICQNMNLAMQAMGLGGWTFTGLLSRYALGGTTSCKGLGFRFHTPEKGLLPFPTPIPVGKDGLFEAFCPPYYRDMNEAVEAFLQVRWDSWEKERLYPYQDPEKVLIEVPKPSDQKVQYVKDLCNYIYDTYGRFPAFIDPVFMRLTTQVHHLDLGFYDRYYPPGAYTDLHRDHFQLWHPDQPDPFQE